MLFTEGLIKKLFLLFSTDNGILKNTKTENIWLESGETFHVMRDHPDHNAPMPQEWTKLISNVIRKISYHLPSFQGLCCYQPSSHCSICNKLFLKDCKSKQLFKERSGFRFGKIFWMIRKTLPVKLEKSHDQKILKTDIWPCMG